MTGAKRGLCVLITCLVGLAGCDKFLRPDGTLPDSINVPTLTLTALLTQGQVYYAFSVDQTSVSLKSLLEKMGLPVSISRDMSGTVRVRSATPQGAKFSLVLRPDNTGKQTHVTIEWENVADSDRGVQFLTELDIKHRSGGDQQK